MSIDGLMVGKHRAGLVGAGFERAGEDVVGVGRDDQVGDGQAHALGRGSPQRCRRNCRSGRRSSPAGAAHRARRADGEVVDDLRDDAAPVDGVDAATAASRRGSAALRNRPFTMLWQSSNVPLERDVVDVGVEHRGHLAALHFGGAVLRDGG